MPAKTVIKTVLAQVKHIDKEAGTLTAVATTNKRDRDGDIVEPEGIDLSHFRTNPVILAQHMHRTMNARPTVIGSSPQIKRFADRVEFTMKWADDCTELAAEYRKLYEAGHMKAFSIGFLPQEIEDEDLEKIAKDEGPLPPHVRCPRRFKRAELIEISCVAVGSNREALAAAFGGKDGEWLEGAVEYAVPQGCHADELEYYKAAGFEVEVEEDQERPPTEMQTLIFSKAEGFDTREKAVAWAKEHDRRHDKVDENEKSFRLRQREPDDFQDGSLRTIEITEGVQAVVGRLKTRDCVDVETADLDVAAVDADGVMTIKVDTSELTEVFEKHIAVMRELTAEMRSASETIEDNDLLDAGDNTDDVEEMFKLTEAAIDEMVASIPGD